MWACYVVLTGAFVPRASWDGHLSVTKSGPVEVGVGAYGFRSKVRAVGGSFLVRVTAPLSVSRSEGGETGLRIGALWLAALV